jgi:hypothetical protein
MSIPNAKEAFDHAQENYKKSMILTRTANAEECRANILKAIYNGESSTVCSAPLSKEFVDTLRDKNYKVVLNVDHFGPYYYNVEFK